LPILSSLPLPKGQKIGLFVVFLTGIFAFAASIVSLYLRISLYKNAANPDFSTPHLFATDNKKTNSVIESSIAIVVGCVPAIWAFWCNYIIGSTIYTMIRSGFSSIGLSAKSWARPTENDSKLTGKAASN
ncbi:hypothetical protein QBC38DRAFT_345721, partial [Podospora fimiseda]